MRKHQFLKNLLTIAVLGAGAYGIMKWHASGPQASDVTAFAERACLDEIGSRYSVSNAKPYKVDKNSNGYVVRVSVILARGTPAKVICLTNAHGGVVDVSIDEQ